MIVTFHKICMMIVASFGYNNHLKSAEIDEWLVDTVHWTNLKTKHKLYDKLYKSYRRNYGCGFKTFDEMFDKLWELVEYWYDIDVCSKAEEFNSTKLEAAFRLGVVKEAYAIARAYFG